VPERLLRLATRGSALALAQSGQVAAELEAAAGVRVELVTVTTTGDRVQHKRLDAIGGKGLFTKEVELALLDGRANFAVHSMKDVPVTMPLVPQDGLAIAAVPRRADVRDVLIGAASIEVLPRFARVGTTSLRRTALLREQRPDLRIDMLRGNVDSRLQRVEVGDFDAILLAAAGLARLGLKVGTPLDAEAFVPAAGQGALALQCRADDADVRVALAKLNHEPTATAVAIEREVVQRLDGDCTSPIGAWCAPVGDKWHLRLAVGGTGGELPVRRAAVVGAADECAALAVATLEEAK
jgi:hydroxymethylbilane synthase